MLTCVASNTPAEAAWAAYDAAAIALHSLYAAAAEMDREDSPAERVARMRAGQEVVRLWDEWRALFLSEQRPRT